MSANMIGPDDITRSIWVLISNALEFQYDREYVLYVCLSSRSCRRTRRISHHRTVIKTSANLIISGFEYRFENSDRFDSLLYLAPPSYVECCTSKAYSIREHDESEYVYGANESFAPKYPVFSFPTSRKFALIKSGYFGQPVYTFNQFFISRYILKDNSASELHFRELSCRINSLNNLVKEDQRKKITARRNEREFVYLRKISLYILIYINSWFLSSSRICFPVVASCKYHQERERERENLFNHKFFLYVSLNSHGDTDLSTEPYNVKRFTSIRKSIFHRAQFTSSSYYRGGERRGASNIRNRQIANAYKAQIQQPGELPRKHPLCNIIRVTQKKIRKIVKNS